MFFKTFFVISCLAGIGSGDRPCQAVKYVGQSVVCVCNATYCDETTRQAPSGNNYLTYTSSEAGSRFLKASHPLHSDSSCSKDVTITLDPNTKYQAIEGFGGSVTDAAGINWLNLTDPRLKQYLIDSYFSKSGLEYNMVRTPVGGSDFSTRPYSLNDYPENDIALTNFSLAYEDYHYKIPMIRAIMKAAVAPVHILATTWSPPIWMKTNNQWGGLNQLKEECYQAYANYYLKFIQQYSKEGIPVWGLTTTNEPFNGLMGSVPFNCLGWTPTNEGKWIANNLGPTLRKSSFPDVKILSCDDQRASIPWWFSVLVTANPKALNYIDGIAVHWYTDKNITADILSLISKNHPNKFILSTEACEGAMPTDKYKVLFGSWDRAKNYILDILDDLNHDVVGWIDWNLCLNEQGGPNWVDNFVDSPIIVFPEKQQFYKQPMYYALGHFSKFLPRGSRRIKVTANKETSVKNTAFVTPRNTVVVVLFNDAGPTTYTIKLGSQLAEVSMEAKSVVTVELPWK